MTTRTLEVIIAAGLVCSLITPTRLHAHEEIDPNDPSIYFERIIAKGIKSLTKNSENSLFVSATAFEARTIYDKAALWTNTTALNVCFWNGDEQDVKAVVTSAARWNGASRIFLSFLDSDKKIRRCKDNNSAHIRVSISAHDASLQYEAGQSTNKSWSLIGRQSTFTPVGKALGNHYQVTMNLPEVSDNILLGDQASLDFTVGHEFGHALGLLHEFQSETCTGWINVDALARDQNWTGAVATANLDPLPSLTGYLKVDFGTTGKYDIQSIMQYNFLAKYYIAKEGKENPCMRLKDVSSPSQNDLSTLASIYGKAGSKINNSNLAFAIKREPAIRGRLMKGYDFARSINISAARDLSSAASGLAELDSYEKGIINLEWRSQAPPTQ